eukprot:6186078-Pleurochrysis_carterae.AAC.3
MHSKLSHPSSDGFPTSVCFAGATEVARDGKERRTRPLRRWLPRRAPHRPAGVHACGSHA